MHSRRDVSENDAVSLVTSSESVPDLPAGRLAALWRGWIRPLLAMVLFLSAFRSAVADWNDVPTGSMKPTILEGDRVFVDRRAYDLKVPFTHRHLAEWAEPRRGDVVVFSSPETGERLVKRVVGIPGDRILLSGNRLSVNGILAAYSPLGPGAIAGFEGSAIGSSHLLLETMGAVGHPVLIGEHGSERSSFGPFVVPAGSYFMMGDNRDRSHDSRWFGAVPRANILGRAIAVVASLDHEHGYRPRTARFFSALR